MIAKSVGVNWARYESSRPALLSSQLYDVYDSNTTVDIAMEAMAKKDLFDVIDERFYDGASPLRPQCRLCVRLPPCLCQRAAANSRVSVRARREKGLH